MWLAMQSSYVCHTIAHMRAGTNSFTFKTAAISAERCCSMPAFPREHPRSQASCQPFSAAFTGSSLAALHAPRHCSTADASASLKCCNSRVVRPLAQATRYVASDIDRRKRRVGVRFERRFPFVFLSQGVCLDDKSSCPSVTLSQHVELSPEASL